MPISVAYYRKIQKLPEDIKNALLDLVEEMDNSVKKEDFNELKAIVAELAEAQKRTEERLDTLSLRMEELAEAQKRTEQQCRRA